MSQSLFVWHSKWSKYFHIGGGKTLGKKKQKKKKHNKATWVLSLRSKWLASSKLVLKWCANRNKYCRCVLVQGSLRTQNAVVDFSADAKSKKWQNWQKGRKGQKWQKWLILFSYLWYLFSFPTRSVEIKLKQIIQCTTFTTLHTTVLWQIFLRTDWHDL